MSVTVAVRILAPIVNATVAPASFVPVIVAVCSLALMVLSGAKALIVGAVGAAVSTVMARVNAVLVLPAASRALMVRVIAPWPRLRRSAAVAV